MKLVVSIVIILLVAILSCEDNTCNTASDPSVKELEDQVIANCMMLVAALDSFAAENDGSCQNLLEGYPTDVLYDTTCARNSLIDLLPDQKHLVNPFTGANTEPVNRPPENPGEIGYEPLFRWRHYSTEDRCYYSRNPGYTICGFGRDSIIVTISNLDDLEDMVRSDCYLVQQAVEQWAASNGGIYPRDVSVDSNPWGDTIIDLLPDGMWLKNHFTKAHTNPTDDRAVMFGEIGYEPLPGSGPNVGYRITGIGREPNVLVLELTVE